jgi:hypothetical protein
MVVFFSTTPCDKFNSRTRSVLLTVNSIISPRSDCLLVPFDLL